MPAAAPRTKSQFHGPAFVRRPVDGSRLAVAGWPVENWTNVGGSRLLVAELRPGRRPITVHGSTYLVRLGERLRYRRQYVQKHFGLAGHGGQLQKERELARIPRGTIVVPYLVNGIGEGVTSNQLAFLRDRLDIPSHASVGRQGRPLRWRSYMAKWAAYTHLVVFDPGDSVLRDMRRGSTVRREEYPSADGPAAFMLPRRESLDGITWVRFESQAGGRFGMTWPTHRQAGDAYAKIFAAFGRPKADDEAVVVVVDGVEGHRVKTRDLSACLANRRPVFVAADIQGWFVTWSDRDYDSEFTTSHELAIGGAELDLPRIGRAMSETVFGGSRSFVEDALQEVLELLDS